MKKTILVKILKNTWLVLCAGIIVSNKECLILRNGNKLFVDLPVVPKNFKLTTSLQPIGNVPVSPNPSSQPMVRQDLTPSLSQSMATYNSQIPRSGDVRNALTMPLNLQLLELPRGEGRSMEEPT